MEPTPTRPWYKKKRYILPLGLLGVFSIAGAMGGDAATPTPTYVPTVQQAAPTVQKENVAPQQTNTASVKTETEQSSVNVPLSNDNYYTNSAGNTVHSPAHAPSVPPGATARCKDGTYSFSQSRRGTCSHHGGVSQWLY